MGDGGGGGGAARSLAGRVSVVAGGCPWISQHHPACKQAPLKEYMRGKFGARIIRPLPHRQLCMLPAAAQGGSRGRCGGRDQQYSRTRGAAIQPAKRAGAVPRSKRRSSSACTPAAGRRRTGGACLEPASQARVRHRYPALLHPDWRWRAAAVGGWGCTHLTGAGQLPGQWPQAMRPGHRRGGAGSRGQTYAWRNNSELITNF